MFTTSWISSLPVCRAPAPAAAVLLHGEEEDKGVFQCCNDRPVTDSEDVAVELHDLHMPCTGRTVSAHYRHIPATQGITWTDDFFEDEPDNYENIVAVFDFDYELMEEYYEHVGWASLGLLILFPKLSYWINVNFSAPCYLRKNVHWSVRAQHLAVTRDGIRFVRNQRPTCYGFGCTDAGKETKTIPFDKITSCEVIEPAGTTLGWIPNTLHTVNVATEGSHGWCQSFSVTGLKDPRGFQRLVLALKRASHSEFSISDQPTTALLREIRDAHRENVEALLATSST